MPPPHPTLDVAAVKARQHSTWSAGDYAAIGTTPQLTGELLCEAVDIAAGELVLDVAAGNGNAALAAARRGAVVTASDYVEQLLDRTGARADAEGLAVELRPADAEFLPFADGAFDVVLSTFGVTFTPQPDVAAAELLRVCRPGGRIGLANWSPTGFVGQLFTQRDANLADPVPNSQLPPDSTSSLVRRPAEPAHRLTLTSCPGPARSATSTPADSPRRSPCL